MNINYNTRITDLIFSYYKKYGNKDYIGENVSQLQHAIQSGEVAKLNNSDTNMILAAFLHDIGHLIGFENEETMGGYGVKDHETIGADFLGKLGFSKEITDPIRYHVMAKRYLISKDKSYSNKLSDASKQTFFYQGGILSDEEITEFEKKEYFNRIIQLRKIDDNAKNVKLKDNRYDYYYNLCLSKVRKNDNQNI